MNELLTFAMVGAAGAEGAEGLLLYTDKAQDGSQSVIVLLR